jgi:hypothetical protein
MASYPSPCRPVGPGKKGNNSMSKRYDPFVFGGLPALVNASRALHEMMAHLVEVDKTRPDPEIIREVHAVMVDFFGAWTAHYIQFSRANGREPVIIVDGWRQGLEGEKAREYLEHFTPIHNMADQLCYDWGWTAPFSSRERVLPLEKILKDSGAPVRPACTRSQLEEVGAHVDVIGRPIPVIPRIPVGLASTSPKRWVDLAGCYRWQLDCPYFASGSVEPSPPGAGVLVRDDAAASPSPDVEYWFVVKAEDGNYYAFGASRWEWFPVVARDIGTDWPSTMPEQHGDLLRIHPSERVLVGLAAREALNLLIESNHSDTLPDDLESLLGADSTSLVPEPASSTSEVSPNSESNSPPESARIVKEKNTEERDKFIYDSCCMGTKYVSIINRVSNNEDWEFIESAQGIRNAAKRYAERHGLPLPGPRKKGRPKGEK